MRGLDRRDALGRRHQAHEAHPPGSRLPQPVERVDGAAARGEHRVDEDDLGFGVMDGKGLVVPHGLGRRLVPVDPEMPDSRLRYQAQKALDHPEPGPEDGDDEYLIDQAYALGDFEGGLHIFLADPQVAKRLVAQEGRHVGERLAEDVGGCGPVAQYGEVAGDQGMVDDSHARRWLHGRATV